uniref:Uncharacterized protein n=1 Tax=Glossina brevipalpis TaxID=37001 RepID=A0A1A9X1Y7_9MUSC
MKPPPLSTTAARPYSNCSPWFICCRKIRMKASTLKTMRYLLVYAVISFICIQGIDVIIIANTFDCIHLNAEKFIIFMQHIHIRTRVNVNDNYSPHVEISIGWVGSETVKLYLLTSPPERLITRRASSVYDMK